jgi:hypothetical protein
VIPDTAPVDPDERREDRAMIISRTDLDLRLVDHQARVARTNRDGWMMATVPSSGTRRRGLAAVVAPTRQWVGTALVGLGARLQGTPARHPGDAAAAG